MTLADVRDWLKTMSAAENYYIGKLDNKKEKSLGVYSRRRAGEPVIAIGGVKKSSYEIKAISLLLHWTTNARETEAAATALFDQLVGITSLDVGDEHISYLALRVPEPQNVGTDDNGVYEYVIEFDLYVRKER